VSPEALAAARGVRATEAVQLYSKPPASKGIVLPREEANLWFLGDVFVVPRPFPLPSIFSPGDVLIAAGAFVLLQKAMLGQILFSLQTSEVSETSEVLI
jgi:hypothetical protein